MKPLFLVAVACVSLGSPAFAQEQQPEEPTLRAMSCREFVDLPAEEQMQAMSDAQLAPGEAVDEPTPASEQAAAATMTVCADNPDMELGQAIRVAVPE